MLTVRPQEIEDFATRIFEACGAEGEQARVTAASIVWCNRIGRHTQGICRLPVYVKRLGLGLIKCPCSPKVTAEIEDI